MQPLPKDIAVQPMVFERFDRRSSATSGHSIFAGFGERQIAKK
jgi:hypothetical protein